MVFARHHRNAIELWELDAAFKLAWRGDLGIHGRRLMILLAVSMLAALYSAWTLYGAGSEAFWWGMALFALGLPHEIPTCRNERCGAGTLGVG